MNESVWFTEKSEKENFNKKGEIVSFLFSCNSLLTGHHAFYLWPPLQALSQHSSQGNTINIHQIMPFICSRTSHTPHSTHSKASYKGL